MQEDALAGREHRLLLLVLHPWHQAQRHSPRTQLLDAVGGLHVGHVVARIRESQQPARRIEHSVEAGDEHLLGHVGTEVVVHPLQHVPGLDQPLSRGPQDAAGGRHHQRGRHTLVGDVADDEPDPPVGQRNDVVEVTAHLARGW